MKSNSRVYVIGHKNPDTDSICSAIAYADIKNRTDKTKTYIALWRARTGVSAECGNAGKGN